MQVSEAQSEDELKRRYLAHVETALALKPGAVVADIGSGDTPEFLPFLSKAVGQSGKVICVDIHEKALEKLRHYLEENGATNAQTHLGKPDDPMLPANSVDAVLISFAYHEMPEHDAMLAHIRTALRPEGRLVVIEAISVKNRDALREDQVKHHELSPEILQHELAATGFTSLNGIEKLVENGGVLRYLISARGHKKE